MALVSNILQHEIAIKSVTSKVTEQDIRIFPSNMKMLFVSFHSFNVALSSQVDKCVISSTSAIISLSLLVL